MESLQKFYRVVHVHGSLMHSVCVSFITHTSTTLFATLSIAAASSSKLTFITYGLTRAGIPPASRFPPIHPSPAPTAALASSVLTRPESVSCHCPKRDYLLECVEDLRPPRRVVKFASPRSATRKPPRQQSCVGLLRLVHAQQWLPLGVFCSSSIACCGRKSLDSLVHVYTNPEQLQQQKRFSLCS